jgi:uncharacterized membrane protein
MGDEKMGNLIRGRISLSIVLALMLAYSVYFSALSIQRHNTFRTRASDMGQMDQALWNTLHGNLLQDTRPDGHNAPRLTDHVEPLFLVIPFVFLVYDGIEALFVVQSAAIALGALPIYWIAQRRLQSDWAGVAFAAMYLMFPALQAANLAEFHAVTFAPAPLMFAFNSGEERAWKRYALFSLIALAVKEDIALLVLTMGAFFVVKDRFQVSGFKLFKPETWNLKRLNLYPATIATLAAAWFALALLVIVPHFSPRGESVYTERYYPGLSRDPAKLIAAIPPLIAGIFIPEKLAYLLQLLASVGFLALFDPTALLVGAPSLLLNLLSNYPAQYSGTYHYSAPAAPYFVLAAIGGAAAIKLKVESSRFKVALWSAALLIALGYHTIAGYTPIGGEFFFPEVTPHQQLLARFVNQIPRDAKVSTTATLFPHLSHRRVLYRFPTVLDAEYILLDVSQANITNPIDYRVNYFDALKQGFGIRDAVDGYVLLQRGLTQTELPDGFYNFLRACHCILPQQPVTIDFGDKVRFLGFDVRQDDWQRVYLRTYWTRLPGMDNNYALFPFYPDAEGNPRAEAQLPPLLVHFWYPTSRWQPDEVIAADTLPIEVGARAQIGIGVFFGAAWDTAEFYLAPRTNDAAISSDGRWVVIGEIVKQGKRYAIVK